LRVAALYDIHGNLPALDAVLTEVRRERVDLVVVGGDVLPGPMPLETLTRLSEIDVPVRFISGNGERVVVQDATGVDISSEVPDAFREVIHWTARQLDPDTIRSLAAWPATSSLEVDGLGDVFFCHATPRNDTECFTRVTPESRLEPVFAHVTAPIVVCGHTHMQFDRKVGAVRVVNAGSVGMPFSPPPGAYWLLLGPDVRLRRTPYDFADAARQIRATAFPLVESLAVRYVLDPPTEAESLQMLAGADLR
jgi:putative phosphoesterase